MFDQQEPRSEQDQLQLQLETQAQHVAIKAPEFMESAVPGWFAIMEAQFNLAKIQTDSTKFYHVLASLPATTIARLDPAALSPPTSQKYETLKQAVSELYEKSKAEIFDQLIAKVQLTGRPSHYAKELQDLALKVGAGEDLVRHKFLQSLPPTVGAVLAAQRELTLHQLGKLADELMPMLQASCFATPALPQPQHHPQHYQHQQQQPQQQQQRQQPRQRPASVNSALPVGLRPFYADQRPQVCRAHIFFGAAARTCKPWCKWPTKTAVKMQPSSRAASPTRQNQEN